MATIRKLKSGKWQALVRKKGHKPACKTFAKKALAERWARVTEEEFELGVFVDMKPAQQLTVQEAIERYRDEVLSTKPPSDPDNYRLRTLGTKLGRLSLAGLKPARVVEYARARVAEVSSDSVRRELTILDGVVRRAMALWGVHLPENPVKRAQRTLKEMRLLQPGNRRERRLRPGEEERLMAVKTTQPTLIKEVIAFVLETAMRRSEIARMRHEHIDPVGSTLHIPASKTDWKTGKKGRTIPLTPKALLIIESLPAREDGLVWGMKPESISQAFTRICKRAGLVDLRFHDLRHEATSRLTERGFLIQEVSSVTGHQDWKSLKRYTHISAEALAKKLADSSAGK